MKIRLLFFAMLREMLQSPEQKIEIPDGATVGEVATRILSRQGSSVPLKEAMCFAVNCNYVSPEYVLHDGDEVAFIPPVAGG